MITNTPSGVKYDTDKVMPRLILESMSRAILAVAEVGTFGARKYTEDNWLGVEGGIDRYRDAKYRHMLAGAVEPHDPESGLLHAAHEAWNALAVLELMLRTQEKKPVKRELYTHPEPTAATAEVARQILEASRPRSQEESIAAVEEYHKQYPQMEAAYKKVTLDGHEVDTDFDTEKTRIPAIGTNGNEGDHYVGLPPGTVGINDRTSDWVPHGGGIRPTPPSTWVRVKMRDGTTDVDLAGKYRWNHLGNVGDIVMYRLEPLPK